MECQIAIDGMSWLLLISCLNSLHILQKQQDIFDICQINRNNVLQYKQNR